MFIIKTLTVFILGAVELWIAVPTGFALQLHPVATCIIAALGAMTGSVLILCIGGRLQNRFPKHFYENNDKKRYARIHKIFQRYGVIGLGLFAPLLTGAPLAVVVGLILRVPGGPLLFWINFGIVFWSIGLTFGSWLGSLGFQAFW